MKVTVPANEDNGFRRWHEAGEDQTPPADVFVITSDGHRIPAHSNVLASASSVLESLVYRPRKYRNSERVIPILGVPSDAAYAFLQFIYSNSRSALPTEAMEKHGVQLLVLAHKHGMEGLKRGCEIAVGAQVKPESVIDVLQIARLCDASRLYQRCLRVIADEFEAVRRSDGWRFIEKKDPRLELYILQYLQDVDQRKKRWRRERADHETYQQLSEAMECLEHICTEGCTNVGPHDKAPPRKSEGPCTKYKTCEGLQLLIRHFATCSRKSSCSHCKRMWQLFRLHSLLCDRTCCRVPLCKQFKLKVNMEGKGDVQTWKLLVKKVVVARVMCSLAKRKRPEQVHKLWAISYSGIGYKIV